MSTLNGYKYNTEADAILAKSACDAFYGIPISVSSVTQNYVDYHYADQDSPPFWYIKGDPSLVPVLGATTTFTVNDSIDPPALLLDSYPGASVAYSLRLLSSSYAGSAIRVRRSSDNAEQDIGFTAGVLDTSTLLTFCGGGNGFISRWYDQSGNLKDNIQLSSGAQPRIVLSGNLETVNLKPAVNYISGTFTGTSLENVTTQSIFTVGQVVTYNQLQSLISFDSVSIGFGPWIRSISPNYWRTPSTSATDTFDFTNLSNMYFDGSLHITANNFLNPHILSSFAAAALNNRKFGISDATFLGRWFLGKMSECIVYPTSQESGYKSGIESNMSTYYSITI
jgi:hypothetical protein